LGNGTSRNFRPFTEAREFVRALNLKGLREWRSYCKSGNKPDDIPTAPEVTYKQDFKGMGDWLGTGRISSHDMKWRPFKEARDFVRTLNLKSQNEWKDYCKSGNKPDDIPLNLNRTYKKEWTSVGDFLGTGNVAPQARLYRSFAEAKEFVQKLGLKNTKEWIGYCKSGNKPDDIPSVPYNAYKKDFTGYGDWLGTGTISTKNRVYRPFKEAREFVQKLGLKGHKEWEVYCKSGNKPDDIPSNPRAVYKKEMTKK
jgi:hypothetical protein